MAPCALRAKLEREPRTKRPELCLTYITRRGPWYETSWKGDPAKSGGVAMNIGVHFFDLLLWLFGGCRRAEVHLSPPDKMAGLLELERADVTWFLSVDRADLPAASIAAGVDSGRSVPYRAEHAGRRRLIGNT